MAGTRWLLQLLAFGLVCIAVDARSVVHVGCFRIASGHAIRTRSPVAIQGRLTPEKCLDACAEDENNAFAILGNGRCRCSADLPSAITGVSNNDCDSVCGDCQEKCGSTTNNALHSVYGIQVGELRESDIAYLGCFEAGTPIEGRENFHRVMVNRSEEMHTGCTDHCRRASQDKPFGIITKESGGFGGLFGDYYCSCGMAYGSDGKVADSNCPGAEGSESCYTLDCWFKLYADTGYYSAFARVDHPTCVVHCGNPSPDGPPSNSEKIGFAHYQNDEVVYECERGYHIAGANNSVSSKTITCLRNGNWSSTPPTCISTICRRPPVPEYGRAVLTGDLYTIPVVGSQVTYTCNSTYQLVANGQFHDHGNYTITCLENGTWSGAVPSCRNETCRVPPPPPNGDIISPSGRYVVPGDSIYYTCHCGHHMVGSSNRTCQHGVLVPEEPECRNRVCSYRAPTYGTVTGNSSAVFFNGVWYPVWMPEEIAYFECDGERQLNGSSFAVCGTTGYWSHRLPRCHTVEETRVIKGLAEPIIAGSDIVYTAMVAVGRRALIPCMTTGRPTPTVVWTRLNGSSPAVDPSRAVQLTNNSLLFFSFSPSDAGKYRCFAFNSVGSNVSREFVLTVSVPPVIVPTNPDIMETIGNSVRLRCLVLRGSPPPRITWHLPNGTRVGSGRRHTVNGDHTQSELVITGLTVADSARYTCAADNGHERNSSTINLHVENCGQRGGRTPFIVGGRRAHIASVSWHASFWNSTATDDRQQIFCGAVFIRSHYVLTAAHCLQPFMDVDGGVPDNYLVKLGKDRVGPSATDITRSIRRVYIHPDFNMGTLDNDIALVALNASVEEIEDRVTIIDIAEPKTSDYCEELPTAQLLLSGFGRRRVFEVGTVAPGSKRLRELTVPIVSRQECNDAYPRHRVTENMVCAGSGLGDGDACNGDSGGPAATYNSVTQRWVLVGIISWGSEVCNTRNTYTVLTRVSRYHTWIHKVFREDKKIRQCLRARS